MATIVRATSLLTTVRLESKTIDNGAPAPHNRYPVGRPLLSIPTPSWVVRTESNVRKEKRKVPEPPCVVCKGSGRVDCFDCHGRGRKKNESESHFVCNDVIGRTNHTDLPTLPKGEWPKWCRSCGGSGLGYCSRCVGTGEYRYIMGFQFMKRENDDGVPDNQIYQLRDKLGSRSFTEALFDDQPTESNDV